jgi:uncharacterized membrane protein YphA (DoxX/SURF4 family)
MGNDTSPKSVLAPLVLRLALGAIFLYHGLDKVFFQKDTDYGASWANRAWEKRQKIPADVRGKVEAWSKEEAKAEGTLTKEEAQKQREAQAKAIEDGLSRVYASQSGELPDSLRYGYAQIAVAYGELVCGLALVLGVLTRVAALAMIVVQVGAILTVTGMDWRHFSVLEGGYEYNVALVAMCLALVFSGGGRLSLDYCLWSRGGGSEAGKPVGAAA